MSISRLLKQTAIAGCLLTVALAIAAAQGDGQPQRADAPPTPALRNSGAKKPQYLGTSQCQFCHYNGTLPRAKEDELQSLLGRVRLDELRIWEVHDPHRSAHDALDCDRATTMLMRLNAMHDTTHRATEPAAGCVQCHTIHGESDDFDGGVNIAALQSEGVSCEACHGPSSLWYLPHSQYQNGWLAKTPSEIKENQFGLIDLHDPQRRAEVCLSCHLGNADEGKLLTHDMFVAGHPPLSGFEIETAADRLPRHWCYDHETPHGSPEADAFVRTRNVLVANLVALRECIELMGTQHWATAGSTPEFARFDCAACHHELGNSGARQARGSLGRPRRPSVRLWSVPLALATAQQVGNDGDTLIAQLTTLHQDFGGDVFGSQLITAKHPVTQWCTSLIAKIQKTQFDETVVRQLMARLTAQRERGFLATRGMDFDSAQQLVGALWVMQHELAGASATSEQQNEHFFALRQYVGLNAAMYDKPQDFYSALTTLSENSVRTAHAPHDETTYSTTLGQRLQSRAKFSSLEFDRLLRRAIETGQ